MKTLTVAVPCYNSQDYMRHAIEPLLICENDIEILIIDDGSSDNTKELVDSWINENKIEKKQNN